MSGMLCMLVGSASAFNFNVTISANTTNYNLNTAMTAAGWNGVDRVIANITVNAGVYVGSTTNSSPALTVGTLPTASTVSITNNGYILGKGGNAPGGAGGPALTIQSAVSITNNSIIGGGGGGGGYGAGYLRSDGPEDSGSSPGGGGGGGAGYLVGNAAGAVNGSYSNYTNLGGQYATGGSAGTPTAGGAGGGYAYGFVPGVSPNTYCASGAGGSGGGLGASGGSGGGAIYAGESYFGGAAIPVGTGPLASITFNSPAATSGGSGGYCTTTGSNAYITWVVAGSRYGTLG